MAWIIDAYNALFQSHLLPDPVADVGAAGLARLIHLARLDRRGATVVADGSPKPDDRGETDIGPVRLIFSGPDTDADSIIEQLIERDTAPRRLTVVSNDRRLIAAAKRRRANSMSSQAFMRTLAEALRRAAREHADEERSVDSRPENDADYWYRRMAADRPPPDDTRLDTETNHWMREFGFEPGDADSTETTDDS